MFRIYVDAVVNHMSGKGREGTGDGGSSFNGDALSFPGVPYSAEHFTPRDKCPSGDGNSISVHSFLVRSIVSFERFISQGNVNDYADPSDVRNCYLLGLTDLYGKLEYVRDAVAGYFNHLSRIGVAGIRIDAAKHMWPEVCHKKF